MAEKAYMQFKCLNSECGQLIQMPRPAKTGVYAVTCPHCKIKKTLKIKGLDAIESADIEDEMKISSPDNSGNAVIEIHDKFIVGEDNRFICPHCRKQEIGFKTDKPGVKSFACPYCQGKLKLEVRDRTLKINVTDSVQPYCGKLTLLRKGWLNKDFKLQKGRYIIVN